MFACAALVMDVRYRSGGYKARLTGGVQVLGPEARDFIDYMRETAASGVGKAKGWTTHSSLH